MDQSAVPSSSSNTSTNSPADQSRDSVIVCPKNVQEKRLKFMFLPMEGIGHLLSLIGLAGRIESRGYEVIFATSRAFNNYLTDYPFKVKFIENPAFKGLDDPQKRWAVTMASYASRFPDPPKRQINLQGDFYKDFVNSVISANDQIAQIIQEVDPDFIFVDYYVSIPAVFNSGKPWACLVSANPLCIYQDYDAQPHYSGHSFFDKNRTEWSDFRTKFNKALSEAAALFHPFAQEKGLHLARNQMFKASPYVNFYVYPKEVDYTEISNTPPPNWIQIDHVIRPPLDTGIGIDINQLKMGIKRVYFSLGSMGSADVDLMNRLLIMMGKTPYQYIVSMGPNHEKIQLPDNAIGGRYINQLKALLLVDLVIFHGGNNTFIECLYYGKPMIILPLFGDQFDNAARVSDKKLGYAFRPYQVLETELTGAINQTLKDTQLNRHLTDISNRLVKCTSAESAINLVETITLRTLRRRK